MVGSEIVWPGFTNSDFLPIPSKVALTNGQWSMISGSGWRERKMDLVIRADTGEDGEGCGIE